MCVAVLTVQLGDLTIVLQAPPPKSQSWAGSAMGTSAGRLYPLSIQAKIPLASTARSKGQFKPPKRARPRDEIDSSMADEELRSIYDVCKDRIQYPTVFRGHSLFPSGL